MKEHRDLYLVTFSLLIWGIGEGLFYIFQPLYIQQLGADPIMIGTVLGINAVGMTLSQIPSGYLAPRRQASGDVVFVGDGRDLFACDGFREEPAGFCHWSAALWAHLGSARADEQLYCPRAR